MPIDFSSAAALTDAPVPPAPDALFCVTAKARRLDAMPAAERFDRLQEVLEMARGRRLRSLEPADA